LQLGAALRLYCIDDARIARPKLMTAGSYIFFSPNYVTGPGQISDIGSARRESG